MQALFIHLSRTVGNHSCPGNGESVDLDIVLLHKSNIFLIAVVAVAGHIAGVAVFDILMGSVMAVIVPDVAALAVSIPGAFALIGGAGYAPEKILRESAHNVTST